MYQCKLQLNDFSDGTAFAPDLAESAPFDCLQEAAAHGRA
jgi:hypothetical protein